MNNTIDDQLSTSDVSLLSGTNSPTVSNTNGESKNFDLKLQLNFLMERLNQISPENYERDEEIQEREEAIEILKKELEILAELHDKDIEAFEEHMAKARAEFNEQKQLKQELVEVLENTEKYCQDDLTKQRDDLIVSIRERDVRLASLQGNFEQQTDTMEREKDLLLEEIVELKDTIHDLFDALNRQEENVIELKNHRWMTLLVTRSLMPFNFFQLR
ncbi:uncharacterized protein EV154DRAFT_476278 [Mucor mucedo]|uniref:uncharacterized protein n=1 Tax=Mucor mucedo TaxID=29922 RepID=UPI0022205E6E|nr:uncharacterized protein EV154DRAFT_476278 [Mucor mucedo]KAI7896631.1 hypothetical protein EV154DRAFT_476278 [Mucor mucedo]